MSSPSNNRAPATVIAAAIAALVLGTGAASAARSKEVLRACVDAASPTAILDERVIRAAGAAAGYDVEAVPFEGLGKGGDGFPPSRFAKLARSDCKLIMGFPVDSSDPHLPAEVQATAPYAATGFVLVQRAASQSADLAHLPKGSEVGIAELDTVAGLLYREHPNIVMHVYATDAEMIDDLLSRRIAAGLAWQPLIAAYATQHARARALTQRLVPEKHMAWNLVALYVPESEDAARLFDSGLQALAARGELDRLIKPYLSAAPGKTAAFGDARRSGLMPAFARAADAGQFIRVAGSSAAAHPPALYTRAQAEQGALAYYQNCSMCHGPALDGQLGGYPGPALKGADFADPSYKFHIKDIFNFVAKLMPAATPGSLTPEQDVDIMAFLLQQNGYPAGPDALEYRAAETSMVPLRYYGR